MGWLTGNRRPSEAKDSSALFRMFGGSQPDPEFPASTFLNHVSEGYDKNELVYACISEKATSAPEAPLRVYDAPGRRGEALEDHPLRRLITRPNPLISEYELFELLSLHLDLAGNAFWEVVSDRANRPVELWPLQPDRVRMISRGRAKVDYGYVVGNRTVPVDVVHFKLPNPIDPLVGTPPMRAALRATALDNEATDFVKALLQNNATPSIVITMSELSHVLDEETTNRLTAKWMAAQGGANRGKPAFLQTGMDVNTLGLNLKDLEFPDLRTISESRICMSFGVPPILVGAKVGLDRSTFANYAEARRSFWEETLMPLQRRIRDTIEGQLLPRFSTGSGPRVILRHDTSEVLALQESEQSRWERATNGLRAGGLSLNDYRREVGLGEVEGGDVFLVPSGVIATRDMAGDLRAVDGSTPTPTPDPAKAIEPALEIKATSLRSAAEKKHVEALRRYFSDRRKDVESQIRGKAVGIDKPRWDMTLEEILFQLGIDSSSAAGKAVSDAYNSERTRAYQRRRAENGAKRINASLIDLALAALVSEDPAAAIAELFDGYESHKAEAMAVTMTTESLGWGATEAGRQLANAAEPKVVTKTWVVRSSRPRPSHARMSGQTVGIDEKFSNGMDWPGDPAGGADEVAGCTCDVEITTD